MRSRRVFHVLTIFILAAVLFCSGGHVSGFFSDHTEKAALLGTGKLDVSIELLKVGELHVEKHEQNHSEIDGVISAWTSQNISFELVNRGRSAADFLLHLQIAWLEDLPESGKFFVYPASFSDELIAERLQADDDSDALIGKHVSDLTPIASAEGEMLGIETQIDAGRLQAPFDTGDSTEKRNYALKLFFYLDADTIVIADQFDNQNVEVGIAVSASVAESTADWSFYQRRYFRLTSVIDAALPVLSEVARPKTFFVTQTEQIDLRAYAKAYDETDGDITERMTFLSVPMFDADKAGTYQVTYFVKNLRGIPAVPIQVTIVVWDFVKISSGYYHTLALTSHGRIYAWGYNGFGQLGDGTYTDRATPFLIQELTNIVDVAAGIGCSYALRADGQIFAWGRNENGRLGDGTTVGKNKPVQTVQPQGVVFTQISCRFATAGAVTNTGDVYTWGYGGYGAAGTGAGADVLVPTKINLSGIVEIELGYYNGAAIGLDGTLYTWGDNLNGQLGRNLPSQIGPIAPAAVPLFSAQQIKIVDVSVGWYHMSAVSEDGRLYTWGYGVDGRLGNGETTDKHVPQHIASVAGATKAVCGYYHTGVITENGSVYFFGQNAYGKHGDGTTVNSTTPKLLTRVDQISDLSLGNDSSFVLKRGREVYGMGYGGTGVLGTGNNTNSQIPVVWAFTPPQPD